MKSCFSLNFPNQRRTLGFYSLKESFRVFFFIKNIFFVSLSAVYRSVFLSALTRCMSVNLSICRSICYSFFLAISEFATYHPNYTHRRDLVNKKNKGHSLFPSIPPLGWPTPEVSVYIRNNVGPSQPAAEIPLE